MENQQGVKSAEEIAMEERMQKRTALQRKIAPLAKQIQENDKKIQSLESTLKKPNLFLGLLLLVALPLAGHYGFLFYQYKNLAAQIGYYVNADIFSFSAFQDALPILFELDPSFASEFNMVLNLFTYLPGAIMAAIVIFMIIQLLVNISPKKEIASLKAMNQAADHERRELEKQIKDIH